MGGKHYFDVEVPCENCGKEFWTFKKYRRNGYGRFCSMSCAQSGKFNGNYQGCTKTAYQRKKESIARHPEKHLARLKCRYAIRRGKIKRERCVFHHEGNCKYAAHGLAEAMHWDYERPLQPAWGCRKHHIDVDKRGKPLALPLSIGASLQAHSGDRKQPSF